MASRDRRALIVVVAAGSLALGTLAYSAGALRPTKPGLTPAASSLAPAQDPGAASPAPVMAAVTGTATNNTTNASPAAANAQGPNGQPLDPAQTLPPPAPGDINLKNLLSASNAPAAPRTCTTTGRELQVPASMRVGSVQSIEVDGLPVCFPDIQPFVDADTKVVMAPVRPVATVMEYQAEWLDDQALEATTAGQTNPVADFVILSRQPAPGESYYPLKPRRAISRNGWSFILVNGLPKRMSAPTRIINGHAFMDVAKLAEYLRGHAVINANIP